MRIRLIISVSVAVMMVMASFAAAGDAVTIDCIGTGLWCNLNDFEVRGNYAYCAMSAGLMVYDISDLSQPVEAGRSFIEGKSGGLAALALSGDLAYVLGTGRDLYIFDISNPSSPSLMGQQTLPLWSGRDISIRGDMAYIVGSYYDDRIIRGGAILIYDVSDPGSVEQIGLAGYFGNVHAMDISGDYAFIGGNEDLYAVNISNAAEPVVVGSIHFDAVPDKVSGIRDVRVADDIAYLAVRHQEAVVMVDVSDPAALTEAGRYTRPFYPPRQLEIIGNNLYVFTGGVYRILDVADPSNPQVLANGSAGGYDITEVDIINNNLFIARVDAGLAIHDIADPLDPRPVGEHRLSFRNSGLAVRGDYVYVSSPDYGLLAVDISDPVHPTTVFEYDPSRSTTGLDITIDNSCIYLACRESFNIFSLANPAEPQLVSQMAMSVPAPGKVIKIINDRAYVRIYGDSVLVLDISDSAAPTVIGHYVPGIYFESLAAYDDYLLVGCQNELRVVDMTDPVAPSEVGYLSVIGPQILEMEIIGDEVYLTQDDSKVDIVGIADPAKPILIGSSGRGSDARSLTLVNQYLFLGDDRLEIYDTYNPSLPLEIDRFETSADVTDFCIVGDRVCVLTDMALLILSIEFAATVYGDANGDTQINVGDPVYLINYIFKQGAVPIPVITGDANCDRQVNVGDAVSLINYIFKSGASPAERCCP